MLLEISVAHHRSYEARSVADACCVGLGIGTVQSQVEVEVGEILLQLQEVIEERNLLKRTCSVEVVHGTIAILGLHAVTLEHMHDLCTQRSHTGTTANPNHLAARTIYGTELSVRTTHDHLVAGLQAEDVRRGNTRIDILEARSLIFGLEGRSGNTHVQCDDVTLVGIVGH